MMTCKYFRILLLDISGEKHTSHIYNFECVDEIEKYAKGSVQHSEDIIGYEIDWLTNNEKEQLQLQGLLDLSPSNEEWI
jgi:hypothetical protein